MNIGERLRQLRVHKGLTQAELVQGICSITYLSRIENGKIKPSTQFIKKVSTRLNTQVEDLLNTSSQNKENRIVTIFNHYKSHKKMTDEDVSFLSLQTVEMHGSEIMAMVFGTLIRHFHKERLLEKTEELYINSTHYIAEQYYRDSEHEDSYFFYYVSCGVYFYEKQDFIRADSYFVKAERHISGNDLEEMGDLYYNLSITKQRIMENKSVALQYVEKSYEIFKKTQNKTKLKQVLITRGVQYHLVGDYGKSLSILEDATQLVEPDEYHLQAMIYYNIGRVHQKLEQHKEAIEYLQKSIKLNELLGIEEEKIYAYRSLIEIYIDLKEWNQVHHLFELTLKISEKYNLTYMKIESLAIRAYAYRIRGDYYTYEKEMQRIIEEALKENQRFLAKKFSKEIGDYFYEQRAYKKSADYLKLHIQLVEEELGTNS
ncbi:tetratricopeptide repeat protein [Rossellomorea aquimaris]|uniref:helix-turn-helix domain-containing protein n=1 Tax=Rossellomorea aquimaris TaxID=189382 RepID=UPI001CD79E3F|nr:tetratricopeptide repeat protein [Rossellomorea aquimaris]MCA1054945.1 tetratricopeptide repeat protein [Rossellomorea aquimaris]